MGISDDELEKINEEMMQAFGGVESLENLPMDLNDADDDESDEGKTATFPFLNRLFGGEGVRGEGAGSEEAEEPRPMHRKKAASANFWRTTASIDWPGQGRGVGRHDWP